MGLQILALVQIQILDVINNNVTGGIPAWLLNTCPTDKLGHYKTDSCITQALACGIIACPIQQFLSCFFVIPERYGAFEVKHINNLVRENIHNLFHEKMGGNLDLTKKTPEEKMPLNKTNDDDLL